MKRTIVFRPERCLMCLSCVLACQLKALGLDDPREPTSGQKPPRRLSLTLVEGMPWAERCRQCVQAPCVEACISGSIVRDEETSAVLHHSETCVGCGTCRLVCPFNAISRNEKDNCMAKCNLCPEESTPPCVGACRTGATALSRGDRDAQEKKVKFAREITGDRKNG
jgi:carbon-monoxide dehydrogenase iron sulfur subunit